MRMTWEQCCLWLSRSSLLWLSQLTQECLMDLSFQQNRAFYFSSWNLSDQSVSRGKRTARQVNNVNKFAKTLWGRKGVQNRIPSTSMLHTSGDGNVSSCH